MASPRRRQSKAHAASHLRKPLPAPRRKAGSGPPWHLAQRSLSHPGSLYYFPGTPVTKHHRPDGLKNQKCILWPCWEARHAKRASQQGRTLPAGSGEQASLFRGSQLSSGGKCTAPVSASPSRASPWVSSHHFSSARLLSEDTSPID